MLRTVEFGTARVTQPAPEPVTDAIPVPEMSQSERKLMRKDVTPVKVEPTVS